MKRFFLLGALAMAGMAGIPRVSWAQTPPPTATPSPSPTPSPVPSPTVTPTPAPSLNPTNFALSVWDFPGPAVVRSNRVESNAQADAEQDLVHFGPSFSLDGRTTGYFMSATTPYLDSHGTTHGVGSDYLVSTFATADEAAAALMAEKNGWESEITVPEAGVTAAEAPLAGPAPGDASTAGAYVATATTSSGVIDLNEVVFQRGIYLIQLFQAYLHSDATKYGEPARPALLAAARKLDAVAGGTMAGPPKPTLPSKASATLLSTRFEAGQPTEDIASDLKQHSLSKVPAGFTATVAAYFGVTAAPPNTPFSVDFKLARGSHSTHQTYRHTFSSYPPGYYVVYLYNITWREAGTYKLTAKLTIGHVKKTGTAWLTVTGHAAAARVASRTPAEGLVKGRISASATLMRPAANVLAGK